MVGGSQGLLLLQARPDPGLSNGKPIEIDRLFQPCVMSVGHKPTEDQVKHQDGSKSKI